MNQISNNADKRLHQLSRDIGKAETKIEEGELEYKAAWKDVFDMFDEFDKTGFRFIANDGHTLTQQKRSGKSTFDPEKFKELLIKCYGEKKGKTLWNQCVVKTESVNMKLVEALKIQGKIEANLIDECITTAEDSYARVRNEWTKEDTEKAAIYGIPLLKEITTENA